MRMQAQTSICRRLKHISTHEVEISSGTLACALVLFWGSQGQCLWREDCALPITSWSKWYHTLKFIQGREQSCDLDAYGCHSGICGSAGHKWCQWIPMAILAYLSLDIDINMHIIVLWTSPVKLCESAVLQSQWTPYSLPTLTYLPLSLDFQCLLQRTCKFEYLQTSSRTALLTQTTVHLTQLMTIAYTVSLTSQAYQCVTSDNASLHLIIESLRVNSVPVLWTIHIVALESSIQNSGQWTSGLSWGELSYPVLMTLWLKIYGTYSSVTLQGACRRYLLCKARQGIQGLDANVSVQRVSDQNTRLLRHNCTMNAKREITHQRSLPGLANQRQMPKDMALSGLWRSGV